MVLQEALGSSLIQLVDIKGKDGLSWLSEFQDQLIQSSKNSLAQGLATEDELELLGISFRHLNFIFDGVRREMSEKSKDQ
jgi:hypothetical protein